MGGQLSAPTREVTGLLVRVLDANAVYRGELVVTLRKYLSDADISEAQALQWTGEKLLKDLFDPHHLPSLSAAFASAASASPLLSSLDPSHLRSCVGRGCVLVLEELKLDLEVHARLFDCAAVGRVEGVRKLVGFVDFDYTDAAGATVLMVAAHHGHSDVVEFLLHLHPPPLLDAQDAYGWSALMHAARHGHLPVVRQLTAHSASVHLVNSSNCDALMCAADQGHFAIVQLLLALHASPGVISRSGDSALLLATKGGHLSVVKALVAAGADVNHIGARHQQSALRLAAAQGRWDLVEYLVSQGGSVDGVDAEGRSVCHWEVIPSLHGGGALAAAVQRGIVSRFNTLIRRPVVDTAHSFSSRRSIHNSTQRRAGKAAPQRGRRGTGADDWEVEEGAGDAGNSVNADSGHSGSSSSSTSTSSSPASSSSMEEATIARVSRPSGSPSTSAAEGNADEEVEEAEEEEKASESEDEDAVFLATERMAERLHQRAAVAPARMGRSQAEERQPEPATEDESEAEEEVEEEVEDEDAEAEEAEEAEDSSLQRSQTPPPLHPRGRRPLAMGRVVEGEDDEEEEWSGQAQSPLSSAQPSGRSEADEEVGGEKCTPTSRLSLRAATAFHLPTSQSFPLPNARRSHPPSPPASPPSASLSSEVRRRLSASSLPSRQASIVGLHTLSSSSGTAAPSPLGFDSDIDDDAQLLASPHTSSPQQRHRRRPQMDSRERLEGQEEGETGERPHHRSPAKYRRDAPSAAAATAAIPPTLPGLRSLPPPFPSFPSAAAVAAPTPAAAAASTASSSLPALPSLSSSPSSSVLAVSVPGSTAALTAAAAYLRPPRTRRAAADVAAAAGRGGRGGRGGGREVEAGLSSAASPSSTSPSLLPPSPGRLLIVHRRLPSASPHSLSAAVSPSSRSLTLVPSKTPAPLALEVHQPKRRAGKGRGGGGGGEGGGGGPTPPHPSPSLHAASFHSYAGRAPSSAPSSPQLPSSAAPATTSTPRLLHRTPSHTSEAPRRRRVDGDGAQLLVGEPMSPPAAHSSPRSVRPTVRARLVALRQAAFLPSSAAARALREATQEGEERQKESEEEKGEQRGRGAADADDSTPSTPHPLAERLTRHPPYRPRPSPPSQRTPPRQEEEQEEEEGDEDAEWRSDGSASHSSSGSPSLSTSSSWAVAEAAASTAPSPPQRRPRPRSSQPFHSVFTAVDTGSAIIPPPPTSSSSSSSPPSGAALLRPARRPLSERLSVPLRPFHSSSTPEVGVGGGSAAAAVLCVSDNIHQSPSPQVSPHSPASPIVRDVRRAGVSSGSGDGSQVEQQLKQRSMRDSANAAVHRRSNSHPHTASAPCLISPSSVPTEGSEAQGVSSFTSSSVRPSSSFSSSSSSSSSSTSPIHPRPRAASPSASSELSTPPTAEARQEEVEKGEEEEEVEEEEKRLSWSSAVELSTAPPASAHWSPSSSIASPAPVSADCAASTCAARSPSTSAPSSGAGSSASASASASASSASLTAQLPAIRHPPAIVLAHADWRSHLDSTPVPAWLHHYHFEGAAFDSLASLSFRQLYQLTPEEARQRLGRKKGQLLLACSRSYAKAVQQAYLQRQQQLQQQQRDALLSHLHPSNAPSPVSRGGTAAAAAGAVGVGSAVAPSTRVRQRRSGAYEVVLCPAQRSVEEWPLVFVTPPRPVQPPQPTLAQQPSPAATPSTAAQQRSGHLDQLQHPSAPVELVGHSAPSPVDPSSAEGLLDSWQISVSRQLPAEGEEDARPLSVHPSSSSLTFSSLPTASGASPPPPVASPISAAVSRLSPQPQPTLAPASLVSQVDSLLDRSNLWLKSSSNALLSALFHDSHSHSHSHSHSQQLSNRAQPQSSATRQLPAPPPLPASESPAPPPPSPPAPSAHIRLVASLGAQLQQAGMGMGMGMQLEPQPF